MVSLQLLVGKIMDDTILLLAEDMLKYSDSPIKNAPKMQITSQTLRQMAICTMASSWKSILCS
jgi:hypothetical protein